MIVDQVHIHGLASMRDEDIDFSDIPELNDSFWRNAEVVEAKTPEQLTMRIKHSEFKLFK